MAGQVEQASPLSTVLRERLSPEYLAEMLELSSNATEVGASDSEAEKDVGSVLSSLIPSLLSRSQLMARHRQEAPALLRELLSHPPSRRQVLICNSSRYLNHALCEHLHELSLDECFHQPGEAVELAKLAVEISEKLSKAEFGSAPINDLRARSLTFLGNALRVAGDSQQAEETFDAAEALLEQGGSGDLLQTAWLAALRGALRGNQRRLEESLALFDHAIRIYRQCGERHLLGWVTLHKANYVGYSGNPERAIELLRAGLTLVDTSKEPRLTLVANHNLVLFLTDLGYHDEAASLLEANRPLYYEFGDRINLLRLRWLEGRIARERSELDSAAEAFLEVREAFNREKLLWDVALVSLELSAVYLEQGRTQEIRVLADELVPIFQATGMHREALASLILFHKAAELEKVTGELIRRTMTQIQSLRRDR